MNSVNIIGRLTRDPELRKTSNGRSVTNFCLAVNRANEDADFIDCVAWSETADLACKYLSKGSQIGVSGRIQSRTYDDKNGNSRKIVEVVIERMQFLGDPKKKEESAYPYQEPPQTYQQPQYQQPQSYTGQPQYQQQTFPYTAGGNFGDDSIDLQSDDFPF